MSDNTASNTLERLNKAWIKAKQEKKLTQGQVSVALGFKQSYFSQLLRGQKPLNLEVLLKLSLYFEMQPLDLAPDEFAPYADAFNAMLHQAQENDKDKDVIIQDLERRLEGSSYNVQDDGFYRQLTPNQKEVLELLNQLPVCETELTLQQLRARVGFVHDAGSKLTVSGLAATDTPTNTAYITALDPTKSTET